VSPEARLARSSRSHCVVERPAAAACVQFDVKFVVVTFRPLAIRPPHRCVYYPSARQCFDRQPRHSCGGLGRCVLSEISACSATGTIRLVRSMGSRKPLGSAVCPPVTGLCTTCTGRLVSRPKVPFALRCRAGRQRRGRVVGHASGITQPRSIGDWQVRPSAGPRGIRSAPSGSARSDRRPGRWWWITAVAVLVLSNVTTGVGVAMSTQSTGPTPIAIRCSWPPVPTLVHSSNVWRMWSSQRARTRASSYSSFSTPPRVRAHGKVDRTDNSGEGNTISLTTYRRADPKGPATQRAVESDVQSAYTALIVREDPADRICVSGAVTVGTETIEA